MKGLNKYIVVQTQAGQERVILLQRDVSHNQAVDDHMVKVVSAGMWFRTSHSAAKNRGVEVLGIGSMTLGIDPRPQDAGLIADFLDDIAQAGSPNMIKPENQPDPLGIAP